MHTVFSHIIQKRFSQQNEDVATDALAFILQSSEAARNGMLKLLRGIVPEMPALLFRTQQTEGAIRPDMWGFADTVPRVFIENKFWAGLTENQPVAYLKQLAAFGQAAATILLVVAPAAREQSLWLVLLRRLANEGITIGERGPAAGVFGSVTTSIGPLLALTSWSRVLSVLEHEAEAANEPSARADLTQLRALCNAADSDAFVPFNSEELSDQRQPAFILQLSSIIQATVEQAAMEGVLNKTNRSVGHLWERIGRYAKGPSDRFEVWVGTHFTLWKTHGGTPLWLIFYDNEVGRVQQIQRLIEPWAARENLATAMINHDFAVALDIPVGEDKEGVV